MVFDKRKHSPLVMKGGSLPDAVFTYWERLFNVVKPVTNELFRLMPDSILFGSAFFALLSQSYPMAIFVLTMLEASFVANGLQRLMTYVDFAHTLPSIPEDPAKCIGSGFAPSLETLFTLKETTLGSAFPSFPIFFLATAASYIVGSVWSQKRELEALGGEYAARLYIAIAITTLLLFATITYRLAFECDGVGISLLTTIFGLIVGGLLLYQNVSIFGRDATNFSGIPLLRERTKDGKPLYVCAEKGVA